ncbi:MAG: sigma-70 family RNA polymerase sigma factor [Planctomycetes bacterium]|nr:sigma-70 family RNA polymerase sigma factor [Planctomycetota bacterium]
MPDPLPTQPERLLEHAGWIRSLARRLSRDAASADDLAQKALVAAIEHPPAPERPLRRWFAAVLRNFAREDHRSETRRVERERRVARGESLPSTAELVERLAAQRRVVEAVADLEEPYRTTILLRFFEGLPPRTIARRLEVPVETVKTRLQRGLERLRQGLDRTYGGDRKAWLLALAPLRLGFFPPAPPLLEAALVNAKAKVLVAALVVLAPVAVWVALPDGEPAPTKVASAPPESPTAPASPRTPTAEPGGPAPAVRSELKSPAAPARASSGAPPPAVPETKPSPALIRGRVLDAEGNPRPGTRVGVRPNGPETVSGGEGRFELPAQSSPEGQIHAVGPELTTVLAGVFGGLGKREPIVVVAPRIDLGGRVVDEGGLPVLGAQVGVQIPESFRMKYREILDASVAVQRQATSDDQGRFAIPDVPGVAGMRLLAMREGFEAWDEPAPASADVNLVITLRRPGSADGLVRGRVVDPDGQPVPDAKVSFGFNVTRADEKGEFAFRMEEPGSANVRYGVVPETLIALKRGLLPARFEAPLQDGRPRWPSTVTLRLGGSPLSITGRVLDASGSPMVRAKVWLVDPTLFGRTNSLCHVENLLVAENPGHWRTVETDANGHFRIEGLLDRPYRIAAMDPATLLRIEEGPFPAGSENLLFRLPADALYERVAGRVSSRAGRPVPGAVVFPMCDAFKTELKGGGASTNHDKLAGVRTDAEGRFELRNVPRSLVYLRIEAEGLIPLEYGRGSELPRNQIEDLQITVDLRCHFKVELDDPASADAVSVLDADGKALTINIFYGNSRQENDRAPIVEGRSHTMAVTDAGRTLVLHLEGKEVNRVPLDLTPGKLKELRL